MSTMATATEIQDNFGRYLSLVMSGQEIIVTKNGKEVGRFIPKEAAVSYLTDSLTGILKEDYDSKDGEREEKECIKEALSVNQLEKIKQEIIKISDPIEMAGFLDGLRFAAQIYCKENYPDEVICDKRQLMDVTVQGMGYYLESEVNANAKYTAMLAKSLAQLKAGKIVIKTTNALEKYE